MSLEIPGYKITSTLGRGGMATVYLSIQEVFEREVALKVMSKALAEDPNFAQRFFREAKIVSKLVHPNIVTVHDVGMHDGHCYLSMEYIDGKDLKHVSSALTVKQKIQVIIDIAKALQYAGAKGYVHRDIKPENIMFHSSDGRAVLMDFGIARAAESDTMVTQAGTAIGTPHYMSPEQAKGKPVDYRSDIYSLGVVFFYILAGTVPYDAESAVGIGIKHITEPVPLLPKAYESLQPIVDSMMAKDVAERYQSAADLISDLLQIDVDLLEHTTSIFPQEAKTAFTSDVTTVASVHEEGAESFEYDHLSEPIDISQFDAYATEKEDLIKDRASLLSWFLAGIFICAVALVFIYFKNPGLAQAWLGAIIEVPEKFFAESDDGQSVEKLTMQSDPGESEAQDSTDNSPQTVGLGELVDDANTASPDVPISYAETIPSADTEMFGEQTHPLNADVLSLESKIESLHAAYEKDSIYLSELVAGYREILALAPENLSYVEAFDDLKKSEFDQLLAYANRSGTSKNLDNRISQLRSLFPEQDDAVYAVALESARKRKKVMSYILEAQGYVKQNSLTKPDGRNALESYEKALALDAGNEDALAGKKQIANKLFALSDKRYREGQLVQALELADRALSIDPENKKAADLKRLIQANRKKTQVIETLFRSAERKIATGQLFMPEKQGAFHDYRRIIDLEPNNSKAKLGLESVVDALSAKAWQMVGDEQFIQVKELMRASTEEYGNNTRVKSLSAAIDEVIGERIMNIQPRIESLKIDGSPIENLEQAYTDSIAADRSIYLGFRYENFQTNTTVIQAVLLDGNRLTQIAQVPVVVEGDRGQSMFRIDRPVDGFPAGSYAIEMRVGEETLNSTLFNVQ